jgi:hypothetical protein
MSAIPQEQVNIFLTVNSITIADHFNPNDPAPIYKRQLSHEFEQYIMMSAAHARRYSIFQYRVSCKNESDKQYTDPLVYSIKRHFETKKLSRQAAFERFKRRNYGLLFVSLLLILVLHLAGPLFLKESEVIHSAIGSGLDIFSWVVLWQPIEKLVFYWNPYLKEISILERLATADIVFNEANPLNLKSL